ncbi:cytochrome-c oxidase, cbb3-type subunit III [Saccharophagus degradans]|uniref:Cbb3-type cytochrome c oxidase subunit n=1 Tax=Saccharophagus degradans TaxID=86304 RepID=A0AAW7XA32_9GAMM|nr:cytochrome-c oxidase, cbb3-type subunit III [Saccharophagus degradans]MDO6424518.1 cytochrome-c oxidase, cbb3-type subunit III [Saccharophagus degradans]MDO6608859.1 cytochrome-c oxidase, cbb3-type subunit III [Saccharophagus degradans]
MSIFWNFWIIGLTLACLALVFWVLMANRKVAVSDDEEAENRTTGHVYDGIEEYDNPLPLWWFKLFIGTMIFGAIYLIIYPGLGSYKGILNWTSVGELKHDQEKGYEEVAETFERYANTPVTELMHDGAAMKMGVRLFANNCAVCHGADAGGNFGFPNLTDKDWLYGGTPEKIKESITHGRQGSMPAWGNILGDEKTQLVANYVLSLSGAEHNVEKAAQGKPLFAQNCAACHGAKGKGVQAVGAPNLTDDTWLYGGSLEEIAQTINNGRSNQMPAQKDRLREEKIHVLTAYLLSLSIDE